MVKNVSPLIAETARILNYDEEVIKDVIFHQFTDIKNFINKPTHARYRLYYLGSLQGSIKSVEQYLQKLIKKMRDNSTKELKEEFKTFWEYRRMLQLDKIASQYKKRFGTWHWKKK